MNDNTQKRAQRSPNYPLQPLEWAVKCGLVLLDKEKLHPVPVDIVAKNLGYKDAKNGAAGRALANLKAFGILTKTSGGKLAVSQNVQRYKLSPHEKDKIEYLKQWVKGPLLYSKLLEKYPEELPSDAVLIFELVDEYGFNEGAAEKAIRIFRESLNFVISKMGNELQPNEDNSEEDSLLEQTGDKIDKEGHPPPPNTKQEPPSQPAPGNVRYPIRLAGGRMAYIDVPDPFYEKDKAKLKAQLEIIGTVDEDNNFGDFEM